MESFDKKQVTEEQIKDNLENGIVLALQEHIQDFEKKIESLSKKELKRLLRSAARFPETSLNKGPSNDELEATQRLFAIKDLQVELAIVTLGRQQEELDKHTQKEDNDE